MDGVTSNTSRITAAMNGMIMIARMMPAERSPMPSGGPRKSAPINGMWPTVAESAGWMYCPKSGAKTSSPHMP